MFDSSLPAEQLETGLKALEQIPRRFEGVKRTEDFSDTDKGKDRLDAISMILVITGETFKRIGRQTEGKLLARYPQVCWSGIESISHALAHGYFDVDAQEVFDICKNDVPSLIETVRQMIEDIRGGGAF
jgi:uncharacterized protein with HEPN domain